MDLIAVNAHVMLEKGEFTTSEEINVCDTILNLYKCILGDCFGFYHTRMADWYIYKAEALITNHDKSHAIDCIKSAFWHGKQFDALNEMQYTSVLLNRQSFKKEMSSCCVERICKRIRDGVLDSLEYDDSRD